MPPCRGGRSNFASCLRRSLVDTYRITTVRCMSTPRWKVLPDAPHSDALSTVRQRLRGERSFSASSERRPGIEPGSPAWHAGILPLNHRRRWSGQPDSHRHRKAWKACMRLSQRARNRELESVDRWGIEPQSPRCKRGIFPLDDQPLNGRAIRARRAVCWWTRWGLEPQSPQCESGVFPLDDRPS